MVTYRADELIPSSQFAKQFGSYLAKIKSSAVDKFAILKNNKVEAILISKEEYERMNKALEEIENQDIIQTLEERLDKPYKTISHKDMLKALDIDKNELKD
jgi:PHD/YefM family antitoxin component YafN of YafNO toxin-antitoxin module